MYKESFYQSRGPISKDILTILDSFAERSLPDSMKSPHKAQKQMSSDCEESDKVRRFVSRDGKTHIIVISAPGIKKEDVVVGFEENILFVKGCSQYDFCKDPFCVDTIFEFSRGELALISDDGLEVDIADGLIKIQFSLVSDSEYSTIKIKRN